MIVEVCANSLESAARAERAGADRIELCTELGVGGITPSYGLLEQVRDSITLPVHVLIRPRSGHFTYSDEDFEVICADISHCKAIGFDGVVSGILLDDLQVDIHRMKVLLSLSDGMHFTFHRAFDWVPDPHKALADLEALGIHTLLTSGQAPTATEGMPLLTSLMEQASLCTIMPGSGIGTENAFSFVERGFRAIHLSGVALGNGLRVRPPLTMLSPSYLSDEFTALSQEALIRSVVEGVK